jgi:ParB family chromosome partitioning protein
MPKEPQQLPARRATPRPDPKPEQVVVPPPAPAAAALSPPAGPPTRGRVESWPIASLVEHDQQAALFHDLEGAEFEDLVASLERKGLEVAVDVTPDGIIINGHQRVRAARRLGWSAITVRVRDDLAGDRTAIDRAHIEANKNRRQLGPLDKVRLARRLAELELGREPGQISVDELKSLCGPVAEQMVRSPRHAQRLISISGLPMPIQKAFSVGKIKVEAADRVSRLPGRIQQRIVEEIEAGGDPAEIVARYLPKSARKVRPDDAYERLVAELFRGLDALEGREEEIRRSASEIRSDLEAFERFGHFREIVVPMLVRRREESERAWKEATATFGRGDNTDDIDCAVA